MKKMKKRDRRMKSDLFIHQNMTNLFSIHSTVTKYCFIRPKTAPVEFDFDDDEDIADDSGPLAPSVPEPLSRLERLQELISRPRPERSSGYLLRTRKDQVRNRKGGYLFRTKKDHQHPHLYFQEPLYNAYGDDVGDGEQVGLHQDKRGSYRIPLYLSYLYKILFPVFLLLNSEQCSESEVHTTRSYSDQSRLIKKA